MCLLAIEVYISMLGPLWLQEVEEGSKLPIVRNTRFWISCSFSSLGVQDDIRDIGPPSGKTIYAE